MSFTTGNDINILQVTDSSIVGSGEGNDRYVLDASTLSPYQRITISDTQGQNTLQLAGGLVIVSSLVAYDSLQLTLDNGSVITVLGASSFYFQTGGNTTNGSMGSSQTYADFVTFSLGSNGIPPSGAAEGGSKTVVSYGGTRNTSLENVNFLDLTHPIIQLNLINEYRYDAAYVEGVSGDAFLQLTGVFSDLL